VSADNIVPEASGATAAAGVEGAFALAWQLTQLYHSPLHKTPIGHGELADRLPGRSALPDAEQSLLLARQVGAGIRKFLPTPEGQRASISTDNVERLLAGYPRNPTAIRQAIWDLHVDLLEALTVVDFQLGKSYGLGRALAETAVMPLSARTEDRGALYSELFSAGRLQEISSWLAELKTCFGTHAAYAVYGTLSRWATWMRGADLTKVEDPGAWLSRQGHVWRGLLSGEKQATDLLKATDFVQAAIALLKRISQLSQRFFWSGYSLIFLIVIGAVVGAVIGIADLGRVSQGSRLAAQVVVALAALGVTAKGVTATLGRIVAKAQSALWDSELDESCAVAACRLPPDAAVSRRPRADIGAMRSLGVAPSQPLRTAVSETANAP